MESVHVTHKLKTGTIVGSLLLLYDSSECRRVIIARNEGSQELFSQMFLLASGSKLGFLIFFRPSFGLLFLFVLLSSLDTFL